MSGSQILNLFSKSNSILLFQIRVLQPDQRFDEQLEQLSNQRCDHKEQTNPSHCNLPSLCSQPATKPARKALTAFAFVRPSKKARALRQNLRGRLAKDVVSTQFRQSSPQPQPTESI